MGDFGTIFVSCYDYFWPDFCISLCFFLFCWGHIFGHYFCYFLCFFCFFGGIIWATYLFFCCFLFGHNFGRFVGQIIVCCFICFFDLLRG